MSISLIIKKLREEKGDTQTGLATALKVSRTTITNWESGQDEPKGDNLKALATYFNVTTSYLKSGGTLQKVDTPDQEDVESLKKEVDRLRKEVIRLQAKLVEILEKK
jgi:transcriptional regulator with XRE-family HTH domain